jgi:Arm DNA-binding domain
MAAHRGVRTTNSLTDLKVRKLAKPGRHADGAGLYFDISPAVARHWVFLYTRNGRRRELGLGGYPETSLVEAREKAVEHRLTLKAEESPRGTIGRPASRRAPYDGRRHR